MNSPFQASLISTSQTLQLKPVPRSSSDPTRLLTPPISTLRLQPRGSKTKPNLCLSELPPSPHPSHLIAEMNSAEVEDDFRREWEIVAAVEGYKKWEVNEDER